ncbi:acyl-CoA dehydrogenase family protein [Amycolatopsis ultiminotia]|uniref:Acyl-CoA dehydrogenase family protein n=1 Tax=Amycolatopsis ultiminotia TaxID=543629 RepID=A0ABP6UZ08_9PSEU
MSKHTPEITAAERALILEKAAGLAEQFAAVGKDCDVANRFPVELVPLYKESGIASAAVPKRHGGLGADIGTVSAIGRELAKGDPAIALSFNMHQTMVGIFRTTPSLDEDKRAALLARIAEEDLLLCGPFSEARAGLSGLADTVAVPQPDGGWRITGKKNWSTLIEGCDLIALNATITDPDGAIPEDYHEHAERESMFIVPVGSPGVSIDKTWDTLGMRATGSQTLVLDEVFAGPDAYGGNFRQGLVGEAEWAALGFAGVYLGLAEKAYFEAREFLKKKHLGATASGQDTDVKQLGYIQHGLGRMYTSIVVTARVLQQTAQTAIDGADDPWPASMRKANWDIAKVNATETAISVTDGALRLVGGASFRRGNVLERLFRDARAGLLHSFGTDQLYDHVGKAEFGLLG